jgi:hypothetical protein
MLFCQENLSENLPSSHAVLRLQGVCPPSPIHQSQSLETRPPVEHVYPGSLCSKADPHQLCKSRQWYPACSVLETIAEEAPNGSWCEAAAPCCATVENKTLEDSAMDIHCGMLRPHSSGQSTSADAQDCEPSPQSVIPSPPAVPDFAVQVLPWLPVASAAAKPTPSQSAHSSTGPKVSAAAAGDESSDFDNLMSMLLS